MITLLLELGGKAKVAIQNGVAACKKDPSMTPDKLAPGIVKDLAGWDPKVSGKSILTPVLRLKLAAGFAGLAYNIAAAEAGRAPL